MHAIIKLLLIHALTSIICAPLKNFTEEPTTSPESWDGSNLTLKFGLDLLVKMTNQSIELTWLTLKFSKWPYAA